MKRRSIQTGFLVACLFTITFCGQKDTFYTNVLRSDVFHQLYGVHAYDFLWVFDNSDSMTSRRQYVRDNLQAFLNILNTRKAVDYQMAVTNTDYFTTAGDLIKGPTNIDVVKSLTTINPVSTMAGIINNVVDSDTSFWEQGLESAYQALAKHGSRFARAGVPLVLIFLTDENDWSCQSNCFGPQPEINTDWIPFPTTRYSNYFKQLKANEDTDVSIFPIVGLSTGGCTVPSYGTRYNDVANAIGGSSAPGSICDNEMPDALTRVAQTLADRGIVFPLSSPASGNGITVFVDGVTVPFSQDNGWYYHTSSNAIVFTGNAVPANGATIEVLYNRLVD